MQFQPKLEIPRLELPAIGSPAIDGQAGKAGRQKDDKMNVITE